MYKTDKPRTIISKLIDYCMESQNKKRKAKYRTLGICGIVGATILGYMTANNMTKARGHD